MAPGVRVEQDEGVVPAQAPGMCGHRPAAARESAPARPRAGLHRWVGGEKKRGTKVRALEVGGAGKKLFRGRSAAWEGAPVVAAGSWELGLRRAGNLFTKQSSAPLTDSIFFPATSSAMAPPVLAHPVSTPCTKLSIASPVQTPKRPLNYLRL